MKKVILVVLSLSVFLSGCDQLRTNFVDPVKYQAEARVGWTVSDSYLLPAKSSISAAGYLGLLSDSAYEEQVAAIQSEGMHNYNWDPETYEFSVIPSDGLLYIPYAGFPLEFGSAEIFDTPIDYLSLLMGDLFIITVPGSVADASIQGNEGQDIDYSYNYTAEQTDFYSLPVAAYYGISTDDTSVSLSGDLNVISFEISSDEPLISGTAVCVFSASYPAGLLYFYYKHDAGFISLIYADNVEPDNPEETGNYFPEGYYDYIWTVYKE